MSCIANIPAVHLSRRHSPTEAPRLRRLRSVWQHGRVIGPRPTLASERRGTWITALVAVILLAALFSVRPQLLNLAPKHYRAEVQLGVLLLAVILGGVAIRSFVDRAFYQLRGSSLAGWRPVVMWCLYVILGLGVLSALDINLAGLLAAGAILGVIVGVAAQTSMSSVFAGIVLVLARPFTVGSWVHLRTYLFGGFDYSGVITQLGVVYTTMDVGGRLVRLPNAAVLASALTVTHVPIQLDIELTLAPNVQLTRLHQELTESLQLGPGESALLRPIRLSTEGGGQLTCQLQIRSHRAFDVTAISRAISASSEVAAATPTLGAEPSV
jgi:small conductance mechanosensitive channel